MKVTTQNKARTRERRGLIIGILTLPFRLVRWLYRALFLGREQRYHRETYWRCNYCAHTFKDGKEDTAESLMADPK